MEGLQEKRQMEEQGIGRVRRADNERMEVFRMCLQEGEGGVKVYKAVIVEGLLEKDRWKKKGRVKRGDKERVRVFSRCLQEGYCEGVIKSL